MADYVKLRTHVRDHGRFLEAGAAARDLWTWGMLYAGALETDGEIPMAAVMSSPWGYGSKRNVTLAKRLVDVGLWERTERGWRVLRWKDQGNLTKADLEAKRNEDRSRKAEWRKRRVSDACPVVTPLSVPSGTDVSFPSSTSTSTSDLSLERESPRGRPEWFDDACATVEMNTGETIDRGAAWLRYEGHRSKERKPMSAPDARYWLVTVDVREAQRDRAERQRRDAADRSRRDGPPPPPKPTAEQAKRFNEQMVAVVLGKAKVGT